MLTPPHILALENRSLFSATWTVAINDPGDLYSAYHGKLVSFTQATGNDWAKLLSVSPNVSIEVQINLLNSGGTASAASNSTVIIGQSGGLDVHEQGVAYELRTGTDPNGAAVDAIVNIDTTFLTTELYFDPGNPASRTGTVPGNKTDAYSTILHELGHVLLWNGFRDYTTAALAGTNESTFDQYVQMLVGNPYFLGTEAQNVAGGPVALTYGNLYHVGNDDPLPGGDLVSQLMNGVAVVFGTMYDFSPLDIAMMKDVGLPVRSAAPTVTTQTFDYLIKPSVSWTFDAPVRWELSLADVTLTNADTNAVIPSNQLSLDYDRGTDTAKLNYILGNGVLPDGNYHVSLDNALVRDLAGNQLDQSYNLDFFVFGGDANHDRLVDTTDFNALAGHFGQAGAGFSQGNFDYAGTVDSTDFNILAGNYGRRLAVPAPTLQSAPSLFSLGMNTSGATDLKNLVS